MRKRRSNPASWFAFTLIEVLVVVAIIALLVVILLPSLKSARAAGRAAVCGSNLHQFGVAISMYQTEHRNYIPRGGDHLSVHWVTLVARQVGDKHQYKYVNQVPVERMPIYSCPERVRSLPTPFVDYLINTMNPDGKDGEVIGPTLATVWPAPARVILLGDAAFEDNSGYPATDINGTTSTSESLRQARLNHPMAMQFPDQATYSSIDKMDFYLSVHLPWSSIRRCGSRTHQSSYTNWLFADMHYEPVKWLNGKRTEKDWRRMAGVKKP